MFPVLSCKRCLPPRETPSDYMLKSNHVLSILYPASPLRLLCPRPGGALSDDAVWRRLSRTSGRRTACAAGPAGMARIGWSGPARQAWLKAAAARFRCRSGLGNIVAASRSACYVPRPIGWGIKRWCCLTSDVCLSVCRSRYIGPKSRTKKPRRTKTDTEVAHVTRDSDNTFKVQRSKVILRGTGHILAASRIVCYFSYYYLRQRILFYLLVYLLTGSHKNYILSRFTQNSANTDSIGCDS